MAYTDGVGNTYVLSSTIGAYADEAYTDAKRLSNTGIVSTNNPTIDTGVENFTGQMRWHKPLNPVINIASLVDPTDGVPSNYASDFLKYIKTARTTGANKVNLAQLVTGEDGLAKHGRDFANTRATDEHQAILAILKGIAISEALMGAAAQSGVAGLGGQTFDNDPTVRAYGMYVDLGAGKLVEDAGVGAARVEGLINAFGMGFKDYEPPYAYIILDPSALASFRSANLIDSDRVTDASIDFETILSGKFRIIQSRANGQFTPAELAAINGGGGVNIVGTKVTYIVLPGAIAMEPLTIPEPVGIEKTEASYHGGGSTEIWYRWGYVAHPVGYNWRGVDTKFPSNLDYKGVTVGASETIVPVSDATVVAAPDTADSVWERKSSSALSLGILPIFHS